MHDLSSMVIVAIIFGVIYKLFELYVKRKERIMLIERMSEPLPPDAVKEKPFSDSQFPLKTSFARFTSLRVGCLLTGLGVGLLAGFFILYAIRDTTFIDGNALSTVYGACVLLGGGISLLVSYMIEQKQLHKKDGE